ncbi:MAG TPA: PH domain-containing protein [Pseudonocardiaceae bacterium]|nr:PH domain-containing protein [Pseudonocardiaceae bacterium]
MHAGPVPHSADVANAPAAHTGPPAGTLRLRDPRHRVHPRSILWWTVRSAVFWLVVILTQAGFLIFADQPPGWLTVTLVISIVAGLVQVIVEPQWRYRVHHWEATQDAVFTRSGWIRQEWRVAPVSRIQTVDTKRGPLEQLLGLATVTVTTASAAGPVEIAGLAHEDAARLVDELTATTQATVGDAT